MSVLGLRRITQSPTLISDEIFGWNTTGFANAMSRYGFTIEPFEEVSSGYTIHKLTGLVLVGDLYDANNVPQQVEQGFVLTCETNGTYFDTFVRFDTLDGREDCINVLSTANATVDEWLLANTDAMKAIKAGQYKWKDNLTNIRPNESEHRDTYLLNFTFVSNQADEDKLLFFPNVTCYGTSLYQDIGGSLMFDYSYDGNGTTYNHSIYLYGEGNGWKWANIADEETIESAYDVDAPEGFVFMGEGIKTINISEDQLVTEEFYTWFYTNIEPYGADYLIKESTLTSIADAIRSKSGASDTILVSNFATEIEGLYSNKEVTKSLTEIDTLLGVGV